MKHASPAASGFVLPVVLGVILIAALVAVQAATELGGASMLATQRLLHQRSFHAAERGIIAALGDLHSDHPPEYRQQDVTGEDHFAAAVESVVTSSTALPEGFSAGRVVQVDLEIRSTGHGTRGTSVTVTQGVRQLRLAGEP